MKNFQFSSVASLELFLKDKSFNKILLITGKKSFNFSGAKKIFEKCLEKKIVKIFYKQNSYPDLVELKQILKELNNFIPDIIIAVGGGSVIDYAKAANVLYREENIKEKIINTSYKVKNKFCKLLAVPTTAGSGAEVTSNAVIYINKKKYSVEGEYVKPDFFLLIPELIIKSSHKIKSSAGFDSIAQSIESLISLKSNNESVNYAQKSLEISLKNYHQYLEKPNYANTMSMSIAANLSGKAINISKTTGPHAMSYPFTSIYGISHGHAVSLTFNNFLIFNYMNVKNSNSSFNLGQRYNIMFKLTKTKNIHELSQFFIFLKKKARLEDDFLKLGIDVKKNFSKIISGVNLSRLKNNPIKISKADLKKILFYKKIS